MSTPSTGAAGTTTTSQPASLATTSHAVAAAALPLASLLHPNLSTSQLSALNAATTQSSSTPQTPSTPTTANPTTQLVNMHMQEERVYKKEKQILLEFDMKSKDLKSQLNEGIKCLEQRLDTQISILYEVQDFMKKRAEVEMQYSKELDKLVKQIHARHKSEKSKREQWHLHSTYRLWESLLNDTKHHSKYHQVASEICSKYVADKFDDVIDDQKRIFSKCKSVSQASHEELFKVVNELNGAMKTYHEYQNESKQAEAKLKYVQSQKPKFDKTKSKKKIKQYEKQVEKRLQKYTETKVKAFKARNEYILSINSANACIAKYCTEDISDLVDCMDFGFHTSVAKCVYMYLSAQENIKRSRQQTVDNLSRSIGDLDSNADKQSYLDYFSSVFKIQKKFQFEAYKGDEVSQVNAQSLIRYEMEKRFEQLDVRLQTLKTENDEIFKTIEATEQSLLNYFDIKNTDMSDLFRDLNLPNHNTALNKEKRVEIEDYYVDKVKQYTISSNLIARLEARHRMMQKALNGCVNSADKSLEMALSTSAASSAQKGKKKIGKAPTIGQPRLFGGKLIEYINVTKQEIPQIITSCVKAINRLGLHNQGIFRIPGSQLEVNQFKEAFEKGEDPLVTVNPREMNSVAGVLKLYLRELKEPLFPRDSYDSFINALRSPTTTTTNAPTTNTLHQQHSISNGLNSTINNSTDQILAINTSSTSSSSSPFEPSSVESLKVENIRRVMSSSLISKPIYIVMRYIFSFLNHLSEFKDENMMDAYNIAICLAPTLIPVPEDKRDQVNNQTDTIELIKLIIQHCDEIFTLECGEDAPVYEKFDTTELVMGEDGAVGSGACGDNGLDESDVEEDEEEAEKQYLRNLSDDDTYVTEAVALYDYKGRSEKELSFKKGTILAIRGQLSTDWWHGSCVVNNNNNTTTTPKLGYIPDKYIALRTCSTKKRATHGSISSSTTTTPQSSSHQQQQPNKLSTPSLCMSIRDTNLLNGSNSKTELMSNGSLYQTKSSPLTSLSVKSKLGGVGSGVNNGTNSRSSIDFDLSNRANLSEFLHGGKESDILDDDGSDTTTTTTATATASSWSTHQVNNRFGCNSNNNTLCKLRSPATNLSTSSNGLMTTNSNTATTTTAAMRNTSLMIKKRTASSTSSHSIYETQLSTPPPPQHQQQHQQYTTYQTLSNPYKPTLKSTTTTTPTSTSQHYLANNSFDDLLLNNSSGGNSRVKKMSQIENALASVLDDMKQLDFSTSLPDEQAKKATNGKSTTTPSSSPFSRNTLHTASAKLLTNSSVNKPRPDLVMDLPLNLLVSSTAPVQTNHQSVGNKQRSSNGLNTVTLSPSGGGSVSAVARAVAKEHLQSSSTTSTESDSSLTSTSSASVNSIGGGHRNSKQQHQDTPIRLYNLEINESNKNDCADNHSVKSPASLAAEASNKSSSSNDCQVVVEQPPSAKKKQPPPLMKKPEKSEEILRKLGRSPPQQMNNIACKVLTTTTVESSDTTSTSSSSTTSSSSSTHRPTTTTTTNLVIDINNKQDASLESRPSSLERDQHQQSSVPTTPMTPSPNLINNKSNLSSRLSNSKATDV